MSTRREAIVIFGYNLEIKEGSWELAEHLEEQGIDTVYDGMCGAYFLAGKILVNYKIDSYENEEVGLTPIELSQKEKNGIHKCLKTLLPDHSELPKLFYVTHYT